MCSEYAQSCVKIYFQCVFTWWIVAYILTKSSTKRTFLGFLRDENAVLEYYFWGKASGLASTPHVHTSVLVKPAQPKWHHWNSCLCNSGKNQEDCLSFFFLGLTIWGSWILKAVLRTKRWLIRLPEKKTFEAYNQRSQGKDTYKKTYSQVVQMGLKLQNTTREEQENKLLTAANNQVCVFWLGIKLTWQTNRANIADLDEISMTEARSSVVHMCWWWQHQLWALLGVRQEHPLFKKKHTTVNTNTLLTGWCGKMTLYSYQKVLCQGSFLWYLEVQSSSYITSLWNIG